MKRKRVTMILIGTAFLAACGGAPSQQEMAEQVQAHSLDQVAYIPTQNIIRGFDSVCEQLDAGDSIADLISSAEDDGAESRDALLVVGGAIRSTCTEYQEEFDNMLGSAFDNVMEGN